MLGFEDVESAMTLSDCTAVMRAFPAPVPWASNQVHVLTLTHADANLDRAAPVLWWSPRFDWLAALLLGLDAGLGAIGDRYRITNLWAVQAYRGTSFCLGSCRTSLPLYGTFSTRSRSSPCRRQVMGSQPPHDTVLSLIEYLHCTPHRACARSARTLPTVAEHFPPAPFCSLSKLDEGTGMSIFCSFCTSTNERHPTSVLDWLMFASRRAQRRNIAFAFEDGVFLYMVHLLPCFYCGHAAAMHTASGGPDRINNRHGYLLVNVLACCHPCNMRRASRPLTKALLDTLDSLPDNEYLTISRWVVIGELVNSTPGHVTHVDAGLHMAFKHLDGPRVAARDRSQSRGAAVRACVKDTAVNSALRGYAVPVPGTDAAAHMCRDMVGTADLGDGIVEHLLQAVASLQATVMRATRIYICARPELAALGPFDCAVPEHLLTGAALHLPPEYHHMVLRPDTVVELEQIAYELIASVVFFLEREIGLAM